MVDENLRRFATDRQWEILCSLDKEGSERKAGAALGCSNSVIGRVKKAVLRKAALAGYSPDHDMIHAVPDGFNLRGVSTYYDRDGKARGQWVKSAADKERQTEIMQEAVAALVEAVPRAEPIPAPASSNADLMAFYPVGDHHIGMLSWHEETGADYDLDIAELLLTSAFDHLIASLEPCDEAVIAFLGDLLHYDSFESVTPQHHNQLDSDTRFPKMVRAATRAIRYVVTAALVRHKAVRVIFETGNHDPASTVWLTELFAALYENEPRVTVDKSPSHFHYVAFGKNLIATHHGDTMKMEKLPLVMATDRPKEWGSSEYRYWWTGHIHQRQSIDVNGVIVESARVLPPVDAWAAKQYRSGRDMKAIIYHRNFGEVERHTFNPAMLNAIS
tara:strand:+ start:61 stop:1224 length:1164 start_codon:yes stop_codon:yes gene_type:complete